MGIKRPGDGAETALAGLVAGINRNPRVWLSILLGLAIAFMLAWGGKKSDGVFHVDEIWQYGFSNSHGKHLYPITLEDGNSWISSEVFRDYLTVRADQRFAYGPIVEAAKMDVHPFLAQFALHTVSSLFPGVFSKWLGLSVNIWCYAITILCLYGLCREFFSTPARALFATAVWAFSLGAINTVMYVRMYCPLTMFAVAAALCFVRYQRSGQAHWLVLIFATFVLGGLTDYIFWVLGFFLTAFYCLSRVWRRPVWALWLGAASLASFITACVIFPFTITQFMDDESLSKQVAGRIDPLGQVGRFLQPGPVVTRVLEYTAEPALYLSPRAVRAVGLGGLLAVLLVIFIHAAVRTALQQKAGNTVDFSGPDDEPGRFVRQSMPRFITQVYKLLQQVGNWLWNSAAGPLALAVFATAYFLGVMFPDYHIWTARGFFYLYPFLSLAAAAGLLAMRDYLRIRRGVLVALMMLLAAREYFVVKTPFLQESGYQKLGSKLKDASVIVVLDSYESAGRLANFAPALLRAQAVYVTVSNTPAYREQVYKALASAPDHSKIRIINTCGGIPTNHAAIDLLGGDLMLTDDAAFMDGLRAAGFSIEIQKKHAHVFNYFNLYKVAGRQ